MKRLAAALLLSAPLLFTGSADAEPVPYDLGNVLYLASGSVTVPPEWDGMWTVVDSVYLCTGQLLTVTTREDTLCSGQIYTQAPPGLPITVMCSGTADATMLDVTCTGSGNVPPGCQVAITIDVVGTRTGTSYSTVTVVNMTYSGVAPECSMIPPSCFTIRSKASRSGPAPADHCATTPVLPSTWGQIKIRYR